MLCPRCTINVLAHVRSCHVCGTDVGFPNVRAATIRVESDALSQRVDEARDSATSRNCLPILEEFGQAVQKSRAVMARSLGWLESFIKQDNELYVSFQHQVRAGTGIPEDNKWDPGRIAAESAASYQLQPSMAPDRSPARLRPGLLLKCFLADARPIKVAFFCVCESGKKSPNPVDKHVGSRVRMRRMMLAMSQTLSR
jgi:hypothetical protein